MEPWIGNLIAAVVGAAVTGGIGWGAFKTNRRTVATQEAQEEREGETSQITNAIVVGKEWAAIAEERRKEREQAKADRERVEQLLQEVRSDRSGISRRLRAVEDKLNRLEALHNVALDFIRRHVAWASNALAAGHIHEDAGEPPRVPDELAHVIPDRRRT